MNTSSPLYVYESYLRTIETASSITNVDGFSITFEWKSIHVGIINFQIDALVWKLFCVFYFDSNFTDILAGDIIDNTTAINQIKAGLRITMTL